MEIINNIYPAVIGTILSFLAAYIIMLLTNRHHRIMQERIKVLELYDEILMLMAEFRMNALNLSVVAKIARGNEYSAKHEKLLYDHAELMRVLDCIGSKIKIKCGERDDLLFLPEILDATVTSCRSHSNPTEVEENRINGAIDKLQTKKWNLFKN